MTKKRLAILISGRGSNMMALVAAARAPDYPAEVVAIVSSRPDAAGLAWARAEGLPATCIDPEAYASRQAFDGAVDRVLAEADVELVALAGFMRILSPSVRRANGTHGNSTSTPRCCPPSKASIPRRRRSRPGSKFPAARCISSPRIWTAAPSSPKPRSPCARTTRPKRWRPEFCEPSTRFIPRPWPWSPQVRTRLSDGRVTILAAAAT